MNQWHVASLQPPHLAAHVRLGRGRGTWYRDSTHQGGIVNQFWSMDWYPNQVLSVQHGQGENGRRNEFRILVSGDTVVLRPPRTEAREGGTAGTCLGELILAHPLDDDYYRERSAIWSKVSVPLFSAAILGRHRKSFAGELRGMAACRLEEKYLEVHGLEHWTHFYTDYGRELQLRFFDHYLKGSGTVAGAAAQGPDDRATARERFVERHERHGRFRLRSGRRSIWTPRRVARRRRTAAAGRQSLPRRRGRPDLFHRAAVETEWSRPAGGEALRLLRDRGCRHLPRGTMFDPE